MYLKWSVSRIITAREEVREVAILGTFQFTSDLGSVEEDAGGEPGEINGLVSEMFEKTSLERAYFVTIVAWM